MRKIHHVDCGQRAGPAANARWVLAVAIALDTGAVGLVERRPALDPIAQSPHRQMRVIGEPGCRVAVLPAAAIFKRLWQVPMVEADPWLDTGSEHAVDQPIVEFQPLGVYPAATLGQDARPRRRQTIGAEAELAHKRHILRPAMVMVAGNIPGAAVGDPAGKVAKGVPDRRPAPVLRDRAFDLVGR